MPIIMVLACGISAVPGCIRASWSSFYFLFVLLTTWLYCCYLPCFGASDPAQTTNLTVQPTQGQTHRSRWKRWEWEKRRWMVWEACSNSNNFLLVNWDFPLPWAPLPPKTRYWRPQGGLVLDFSGSVRCCCWWWGGKGGRCSLCPPARWELRILSAAVPDTLAALLPWVSAVCLLPRSAAAHLFLCEAASQLGFPLPMGIGTGSAGWQAGLNQDLH